MRYESKFDIGQRVVSIHETQVQRIIKCLTCSHTGSVKIGEEEFVCPKCKGASKHPQWAGHKWMLDLYGQGVVSKIEIEHRDSTRWEGEPELKVSYMLNNAMGGTIYAEKRMFASREEAQAECDRRNTGGSWEDEA